MSQNSFFQELKQRKVFKVASIYAVTAWLIIQIVATTFPIFNFPNWTQQLLIVIVLIGFPITLLLAWAYEIVPDRSIVSEDGEPKKRGIPWFTYGLIVGCGLLGFVLWSTRSNDAGSTQLLKSEIREEKVAVNIFENKTGLEELDALGSLAAEWIGSGLMELKIRTVSPEMVRRNQEFIGILPDDPAGRPSFATITGARYMITGEYYLKGDSISLYTRLTSALSDEVIHTFEPIVGSVDQKEKLVDEARQYLLGFWATKGGKDLPKINPPKLDAFKVYQDCFITDMECYQEAIELDPQFLSARAYYMYNGVLFNIDSIYNQQKSYLEEHWDQLTRYEKNQFRYAEAMWEGDYQAAFEALDANVKMDPEDYLMLFQSGGLLNYGLNRPKEATRRYENLFSNVDKGFYDIPFNLNYYNQYLEVLNKLGNHEQVTQFFFALPEQKRLELLKFFVVIHNLYIALDQQNRNNEIFQLIEDNENRPERLILAAYNFANLHPSVVPNPFEEPLRILLKTDTSWYSSTLSKYISLGVPPFRNRAVSFYILQDWDAAEQHLLPFQEEDWSTTYPDEANGQLHKLWVEATLGCVYAEQGKRSQALQQLDKVKAMTQGDDYSKIRSHHMRGYAPYLVGRIFACLGEKEKAVEQLRLAREKGRVMINMSFHWDLFLVNLKGYQPFEDLLKPEG